MKYLKLALLALTMNVNAAELEADQVCSTEGKTAIIGLAIAVLLLDEDDGIVGATLPPPSEGTCGIIINGIPYTYWCDINGDPVEGSNLWFTQQ